MESRDKYIKAGSLIGIGVVNACRLHETDPVMALLSGHIEDAENDVRREGEGAADRASLGLSKWDGLGNLF